MNIASKRGRIQHNAAIKKYTLNFSVILDPPQPVRIFYATTSLKLHKACGCDNISAALLCMGNKILAPIITVYFAVAFEHGFFLKFLKLQKQCLFLKVRKEILQIIIDQYLYYLAF